MAKRKMTIESLAVMIKRGFDQTASKQDLAVVKQDLADFRKEVHERFMTVGDDIKDIKITLGPLVGFPVCAGNGGTQS